jgi:hypothetical protein
MAEQKPEEHKIACSLEEFLHEPNKYVEIQMYLSPQSIPVSFLYYTHVCTVFLNDLARRERRKLLKYLLITLHYKDLSKYSILFA